MMGWPAKFKFSCRTAQSIISISGSRAVRFCTAASFTKRAHRLGCEAGTANAFFEPSAAAASGGHQWSNRPWVLKCTHKHALDLSVSGSRLCVSSGSCLRARPTQTKAHKRLGGSHWQSAGPRQGYSSACTASCAECATKASSRSSRGSPASFVVLVSFTRALQHYPPSIAVNKSTRHRNNATRLQTEKRVPRQMKQPAALGPHLRAEEADPLLCVPVRTTSSAGSNFCLSHHP